MLIHILHYVAFGGYLAAAGLLGLSFVRGSRDLPVGATLSLGVGFAAHAAGLVAYSIEWGELPLVGLGPSLSTLALIIALGALSLATLRAVSPLGLVLLPLVVVLVGTAMWSGVRPSGEHLAFRGLWFALHVLFAMVGYAALALAFAAGLMYLLQFRELKSKHFGAVFRFFPALDTLDRVGRRALLVGFPALTLALVLGWAWTARFQHSLEVRNPKVLWGVLSWTIFVAALLARKGSGRQGRRAALASVLGFALIVASYLWIRVQTPGAAFL
ncbi:MAG: cytochrome c biogenesis protein CcsA [Gemmatimonadetes bacterium]|nr:cytochrome c biogenesis protein CcsA [Gemmatimonadota bacterium]